MWPYIAAFFLVNAIDKERQPKTDQQRENNKHFLAFLGWVGLFFMVLSFVGIVWDVAHGQTTNRTFQDSMGRNIGRSSTDTRGNTTFYDSMGRNTGRSSTQNGVTTIYNERGQMTGRSTR